jgi:DNA-binding transcriptional LysR family regulator
VPRNSVPHTATGGSVELVRACFGCAFLSDSLTVGARPVLLRPLDPSPVFEVFLITPASRRMSAAVTGFVDLLTASDLRGTSEPPATSAWRHGRSFPEPGPN